MKYVPKSVTRVIGRQVLRTRIHAPQILFVTGLGAVVGGAVLACKATLEVEDVLVDHNKNMLDVSRLKNPEVSYERERRIVTLHTTGRLMKLYAPATVTMGVGVVCLTRSHQLLVQRNTALTAAYVGLQRFLEGYRGRVREEIGEDREKAVYYASTPVELVEDTKKGPKVVYGSAPTGSSPYSCVIDESKRGIFQDTLAFNKNYVAIQQQLLTDKLRSQGYLFLNDVYTRFDVSHTFTGQICGWFVGHPDSDDFVDISVTPLHDGRGSIMLDFNVGGNVAEMLGGGSDSDHPFTQKVRAIGRGKS